MKKIFYSALILSFTGLQAFVLISNWTVKSEGTSVKFSSGKINGSFKGLKATIAFDKEHPEQAKITATIDAPSIATGFFSKDRSC